MILKDCRYPKEEVPNGGGAQRNFENPSIGCKLQEKVFGMM